MNTAVTSPVLEQRLQDIDEAMWLRAREGDVAAAKLVYARLAEALPPPVPTVPPTWAEVQQLLRNLNNHYKELTGHGLLADFTDLDSGASR